MKKVIFLFLLITCLSFISCDKDETYPLEGTTWIRDYHDSHRSYDENELAPILAYHFGKKEVALYQLNIKYVAKKLIDISDYKLDGDVLIIGGNEYTYTHGSFSTALGLFLRSNRSIAP